MSYASSNSSGFGNNPPRGPSLYDPARAAEMKKLNATMTPAGSKPRSGRGISSVRGGRSVRGRGDYSNVGDRSFSAGRGVGMLGDHFVRPVHGPATTEPTSDTFPTEAHPATTRSQGFIAPHLRTTFNAVPPPQSLTASSTSRRNPSRAVDAHGSQSALNASWGEVEPAVNIVRTQHPHANWGPIPAVVASPQQAPVQNHPFGNAVGPQVAARVQENSPTSWGPAPTGQPATVQQQVPPPTTTWGGASTSHGQQEEVSARQENTTWGVTTGYEATPAPFQQQAVTTWGNAPAATAPSGKISTPVGAASWRETSPFVQPAAPVQYVQPPNQISGNVTAASASQTGNVWSTGFVNTYGVNTTQQTRPATFPGPQQPVANATEYAAAYVAPATATVQPGANAWGPGSGVAELQVVSAVAQNSSTSWGPATDAANHGVGSNVAPSSTSWGPASAVARQQVISEVAPNSTSWGPAFGGVTERQVVPNVAPSSTSWGPTSGGVSSVGLHQDVTQPGPTALVSNTQAQTAIPSNVENRSRARADSLNAHLSPPEGPQVVAPTTRSRGEPIVTNWGPDPVGPYIPGHFRQRNAFETIWKISRETGIPIEQLTSDGVSIPAARPENFDNLPIEDREAYRQREEQIKELGRQFDLLMGSPNNPTAAASQPIGGSSSNEANDVVMSEEYSSVVTEQPRVANLQDSIWNTPEEPRSVARPDPHLNPARARVLEPSTASYPPTPAYGAPHQQPVRAALQSMNTAAPQPAPYARPGNAAARSGPQPGEKTLKDSMWA